MKLHPSTVSDPTISKLEDGVQGDRIFFTTIVRLARALEVPIDYFVTPDGRAGLPLREAKGRSHRGTRPHPGTTPKGAKRG
jgi:transcriptional regulator with XRE-family HTH domain